MDTLDGRVAIITGAAQGLGAATSRLLAAEGAEVILCDIADDLGHQVAEEIGEPARYRHLDVRREEDWSAVVDGGVSQFGRIDILVNNAAILRLAPLVDITLDEYVDTIMVNQVGSFLGMRTAAPAMAPSGGSIVNISSVDGLKGMVGTIAYGASKWALRGMTKVAAMELGPFGIRVNSVHPGGMNTSMSTPEAIRGIRFADPEEVIDSWPLARLSEPAEVARLVLFLASDASSFCTGAEFVIDGGQTAGPPYGSLEDARAPSRRTDGEVTG